MVIFWLLVGLVTLSLYFFNSILKSVCQHGKTWQLMTDKSITNFAEFIFRLSSFCIGGLLQGTHILLVSQGKIFSQHFFPTSQFFFKFKLVFLKQYFLSILFFLTILDFRYFICIYARHWRSDSREPNYWDNCIIDKCIYVVVLASMNAKHLYKHTKLAMSQ